MAKVHFLVVPKLKIPLMIDVEEKHAALMGHLLVVVAKVAKEQGLTEGYRTVINNGEMAHQLI